NQQPVQHQRLQVIRYHIKSCLRFLGLGMREEKDTNSAIACSLGESSTQPSATCDPTKSSVAVWLGTNVMSEYSVESRPSWVVRAFNWGHGSMRTRVAGEGNIWVYLHPEFVLISVAPETIEDPTVPMPGVYGGVCESELPPEAMLVSEGQAAMEGGMLVWMAWCASSY
ncbi:hypothetical protein STEG23_034661, partial [Scotinomys teguina]